MWFYVKQVIPSGVAIFDHRTIIWSSLVEQNRKEHHFMIVDVDGMVLQNHEGRKMSPRTSS